MYSRQAASRGSDHIPSILDFISSGNPVWSLAFATLLIYRYLCRPTCLLAVRKYFLVITRLPVALLLHIYYRGHFPNTHNGNPATRSV
ncbi:hypothetical protein BV22DRAFT_587260 [Leucogyrophana mollusca]|uniref:Uncharacterized protein n=1 Tax=Leucogyrophana mollusca TaxID=85980 RepID=A0ACB8BCD3_9AGAM|nr:hypothetical protein BV22DRAFT_587260 [Leucogyrophana mollusca]